MRECAPSQKINGISARQKKKRIAREKINKKTARVHGTKKIICKYTPSQKINASKKKGKKAHVPVTKKLMRECAPSQKVNT